MAPDEQFVDIVAIKTAHTAVMALDRLYEEKEGLLLFVPRTKSKRPLLRGHGARADQAFVTQGNRR